MRLSIGAIALCCVTLAFRSFADAPPPAEASVLPAEAAVDAASKNAMAAMQAGPRTIELKDQARIDLPDGYGFVPNPQAAALMEASGNSVDDRFIGLVLPLSTEHWFATLE